MSKRDRTLAASPNGFRPVSARGLLRGYLFVILIATGCKPASAQPQTRDGEIWYSLSRESACGFRVMHDSLYISFLNSDLQPPWDEAPVSDTDVEPDDPPMPSLRGIMSADRIVARRQGNGCEYILCAGSGRSVPEIFIFRRLGRDSAIAIRSRPVDDEDTAAFQKFVKSDRAEQRWVIAYSLSVIAQLKQRPSVSKMLKPDWLLVLGKVIAYQKEKSSRQDAPAGFGNYLEADDVIRQEAAALGYNPVYTFEEINNVLIHFKEDDDVQKLLQSQ